MSDKSQTTDLEPICGQPERYDRGECGYPHCGCFDRSMAQCYRDLMAYVGEVKTDYD